jgi:FAD-linked sulfhydryl oxidase
MVARRSHITLVALLLAGVFVVFFVAPSSPREVVTGDFRVPTTVNDIKNRPEEYVTPPAADPAHKTEKQSFANTEDTSQSEVPVSKDDEAILDWNNGDISRGQPIMGKMTNQTIRAELGRAAWKVFHTILAQYPENPTAEERKTLDTYIHLFSRVYPCRECAEHFQVLLQQFPPQLSSRESASQWGCHVHNQVNKRLEKPTFNCMDISDKYACGCAEDEEDQTTGNTKI